jgi:hypothetical protein
VWTAALLLVVVVGPLVPIVTAQPAVRIAQTAALVEHQNLEIDPYASTVLVDRVEHEGHVYSDKAPLQAFLATPVYAVGRAVGMESAEVDRARENLTVWWVTLWTSVLPAAGLLVLMAGAARRAAPGGSALAAFGLSFGTLLLPFAGQLYAHVLCTFLAFAAWRLLTPVEPPGPRGISAGRLLVVGALLGASVAAEYPMALVAGIVAVAGGALVGWRRLPWIALGAAPFAAFVLWYHDAAFGSPLTDPYRLKPQHEGASAAVTGWPRPAQAVEVLVGSRGLLLFAPVVAVGVVGLVQLVRRGGCTRVDGVVGLAVFLALWLLQAGWSNPWGGEMPGPRYVIAALPFLAPGVALVAETHRPLVRLAVAWGVVAMAAPLLTLHLVPDGGATVVSHLDNLADFGATPPVTAVAWGRLGWVPYLLAVGAAAWLTATAFRRAAADAPTATAVGGAGARDAVEGVAGGRSGA